MLLHPLLSATLCIVAAIASSRHDEAELPPGFRAEALDLGLEQALGLTFAADGRMAVWEKSGVVWWVRDGVKLEQPLIDLREEVANFSSHGLKSVALDPDFLRNGRLYLLYDVDRHHLFFHGTPQYDPQADDFSNPTISRLTRYRADAASNFATVDPASRQVLIGATPDTGIPQLHAHDCGSLVFAEDGSLLVSSGDGGWVAPLDTGGDERSAQALAEGILTPEEDVGSFRSQLLDSHCGKILRIAPRTGEGLPDNPYFDPQRRDSPRSRVWALGLRSPFRMCSVPARRARGIPGTGLPGVGPSPGRSGPVPFTLAIGDVGNHHWEELNLVDGPGLNFGWPIQEGMELEPQLGPLLVENPGAPNPLFDGMQCTQEFLHFQDLLVQEQRGRPFWPNPCDAGVEIPSHLLPQMHSRPHLCWGHSLPARAKAFDAQGTAIWFELDDPLSPIAGAPFTGSCSIAGTWLEGDAYPEAYRDAYLQADYEQGWLRRVVLGPGGRPREVHEFGEHLGSVVALAEHPLDHELYYVRLGEDSGVVRIAYYGDDVPPSAVGEASPRYGPAPLIVDFDSSGSEDPEDLPLEVRWTFGAGLPVSRSATSRFVFPSQDVTDQGSLIAWVLELDPPQDIDFDGFDPSVVYDGVFPSPLNFRLSETYYTYYDPFADKGDLDWLGYEFGEEHEFHALVFQDAVHAQPLGGWFDELRIEVRQADVWTDVGPLLADPPYLGEPGPDLQIHILHFDPLLGDAVRLIGTPGGDWDTVGCSELRALAIPAGPHPPTRFDVELEVRDASNATDQMLVPVWLENTPPEVEVLSPPLVSSFPRDEVLDLPLQAMKFDAEHDEASLECAWQVQLMHNQHSHPEPIDRDCDSMARLEPHDEGLGEVIYYVVSLSVTDPLGLGTTVRHYLHPEDDCNLNGYPDEDDIAQGRSQDTNLDGIPDECERDCNGNGIPDPIDLVVGISEDLNENGIPDECE